MDALFSSAESQRRLGMALKWSLDKGDTLDIVTMLK